ncbi:ABC transporter permease [Clostridium cylindrosporum]|uniref:Spermidine/putrescine transport system permease protein PotB n=1 Tax=Clostridium cylindrosporum DSM 605 TaxID=1121307 RepID=A0A0J8D977_CLOCY|nr:ABC transporter permease [Clostridium cylindrosporum]KMT22585.1 spermidine/putrescine transport system permease protein PotB [Clostridium cylindrosporum DSM 605]
MINRKKLLASPHIIWTILFTIIPVILIFSYSFTYKNGEGVRFTLEHFKRFLEPLYLDVLWRSILLALVSTIICLILGYPLAMILANSRLKSRNLLVLLLIIPMWMNFLLRTYAWMNILEKSGLLNKALSFIGLPTINIMYTNYAVVLGMVYNFLPFMILPIYTVLTKIDNRLVEAAQDLGANKVIVFKKVILPLSIPGVISGITMVFMPAVTTFVISRLLGGGQYTLIGNLIEQQFLTTLDWNFGSAISVIMLIVILMSMGIMSKYDKDKEGVGLW